MTRIRYMTALSLFAAAGLCQAQTQVSQNDIAVGWSQGTSTGTSTQGQLDNTIQLFSAPTGSPATSTLKTDTWNLYPFIEGVVWDNLGGIQHNPNGHLLAIDFGTTAQGLQLYSYPSGSNASAVTALFNGNGTNPPNFSTFGVSVSRSASIACSPDNTKIAVGGYDIGQVYVFTYDASTPAITNVVQTQALPTIFNARCNPGVGWLNNTTILVTGTATGPSNLYLPVSTIDVTDPNLTVTQQITLPFAPTGLSESCNLSYSPLVAPYIYVSYSTFTGTTGTPPNTTINKLFIIDPRTNPWSNVATIDLSTSCNTLRGIAQDSHGNLFITQFAGTGANPTIQELVGASSPASLTDNSSVIVYTDASGAFHSNFAYIDVAQGVGGAACYPNCDGSTSNPILNANDFQCFLNKYAANDPYANCDGSTNPPTLNANDFQCFLNKYAAGCT